MSIKIRKVWMTFYLGRCQFDKNFELLSVSDIEGNFDCKLSLSLNASPSTLAPQCSKVSIQGIGTSGYHVNNLRNFEGNDHYYGTQGALSGP